jgi:hypothetical protein
MLTPSQFNQRPRRRSRATSTSATPSEPPASHAGRRTRMGALRRYAATFVAGSTLATAVVVISATSASAVAGFSASGNGLALRTAPSTTAAVIGRYSNGQPLDIACQTTGTSVNGSNIWDQITGTGGYVSDYFVNGTPYGQFDNQLPRCGQGAASASGGPTVLGGVDVTGYCRLAHGDPNAFAQVTDPNNAYSWRCAYEQMTWWTLAGVPGSPTKANYAHPWATAGVDMNAACWWQYNWNAHAALGNPSNPYSWYCVR